MLCHCQALHIFSFFYTLGFSPATAHYSSGHDLMFPQISLQVWDTLVTNRQTNEKSWFPRWRKQYAAFSHSHSDLFSTSVHMLFTASTAKRFYSSIKLRDRCTLYLSNYYWRKSSEPPGEVRWMCSLISFYTIMELYSSKQTSGRCASDIIL